MEDTSNDASRRPGRAVVCSPGGGALPQLRLSAEEANAVAGGPLGGRIAPRPGQGLLVIPPPELHLLLLAFRRGNQDDDEDLHVAAADAAGTRGGGARVRGRDEPVPEALAGRSLGGGSRRQESGRHDS